MILDAILNEKHELQDKIAKECNYDSMQLAEKAAYVTNEIAESLNLKSIYYSGQFIIEKSDKIEILT